MLKPSIFIFREGTRYKAQKVLAQKTVQGVKVNLPPRTINSATFLFMKVCGTATHHRASGSQLQIKTLKFRCLHICWVCKTLRVARGDSRQYCQRCQEPCGQRRSTATGSRQPRCCSPLVVRREMHSCSYILLPPETSLSGFLDTSPSSALLLPHSFEHLKIFFYREYA